MKDTSLYPKNKEVSEALKLVLVSLDSMLIPGIEAEKMRATREVVENCIKELEECGYECKSHQANG